MGLMNGMMDMMIKSISKEKREQMMIEMMPKMIEGIDMNEFMPRMMEHMLKDLTVDDIVAFIRRAVENEEKLQEIGNKIGQANMMSHMMFKSCPSKYGFEETIEKLKESAVANGWHIPDIRDLQQLWTDSGVENAEKIKVLYFCNAQGGSKIAKDGRNIAMSVMMPMGVSVYETSEGKVEVAAMNLGMMKAMFSGATKEVLDESAVALEKSLAVLA
jgi:uncharacterized protein (DUF302 family)